MYSENMYSWKISSMEVNKIPFLFFQEEEPQEVDEESGKEETEEQEIPD